MLSLLPFEALALALGFLPAASALGFLPAALVFLLAALLFALVLGGLGASTTGGFFGALLLLEEHRVLNFQETMTNGEYLQELLSKRKLHSIFSRPMALFDKLIYGFQSPDKNDFELFREFYLELEKQEK